MSLVFHGIITDLKKSFVVAKLRHRKHKSSKIAKFVTRKYIHNSRPLLITALSFITYASTDPCNNVANNSVKGSCKFVYSGSLGLG